MPKKGTKRVYRLHRIVAVDVKGEDGEPVRTLLNGDNVNKIVPGLTKEKREALMDDSHPAGPAITEEYVPKDEANGEG